jgi:hypothetical protein
VLRGQKKPRTLAEAKRGGNPAARIKPTLMLPPAGDIEAAIANFIVN